jgi:hypothetical protein
MVGDGRAMEGRWRVVGARMVAVVAFLFQKVEWFRLFFVSLQSQF